MYQSWYDVRHELVFLPKMFFYSWAEKEIQHKRQNKRPWCSSTEKEWKVRKVQYNNNIFEGILWFQVSSSSFMSINFIQNCRNEWQEFWKYI